MKKTGIILIMTSLSAVPLLLMSRDVGAAGDVTGCRANDKGKAAAGYDTCAKPDTIFQKIGDFMTGNYEVRGKPIKKTGLFQPVADEIERTRPAVVR